jgi:type IV secretory pathway VirB2 component (pilin)
LALRYGLSVNLKNLNAKSLFLLATFFAAASALMHSIWYATQGVADSFTTSLVAMFVGNLLGTVIVLYVIRAGLIMAGDRWQGSKHQSESD